MSTRPAAAMELVRANMSQDFSAVFARGEIAEGDSQRFDDVTKDMQRGIVNLRGPGGSVAEALSIGAEIRIRGFATSVGPEQECYSACALIWLSGVHRYLSPSSVIGFHAAYVTRDGHQIETGMGNAEIGAYVAHLGLRVEAVRFVTQAPPAGMNLLTPALARSLGIEIFENTGPTILSPQESPTADMLATSAAMLGRLLARCSSFFYLDEKKADDSLYSAVTSGHQLVGGEVFGGLLVEHIEIMRAEIAQRGPVDVVPGCGGEATCSRARFGLTSAEFRLCCQSLPSGGGDL